MSDREISVVTGAFGYTGKYIARRLLAAGASVATLTNHPQSDPRITAYAYDFYNPARLIDHLRGATTLYNTYWVRFPHGGVSFDRAVENSRALIAAAKAAGVQRIVHVSITNAGAAPHLPYFRGKGLVEEAITESGLSYAILRPTLVFGVEDVLVNNIAWFLRRFPVFGVPGNGEYPVRPVYVDDLAALAVTQGSEKENTVIDAVGPDTFTFEEIVRMLARGVGSNARILHAPPLAVLAASKLAGVFLRDRVLTWDEIDGLMAGALTSDSPPTATTRFSDWLAEHGSLLGREYQSELRRHY